jgi:hypothetical protein
MRGIPTWEDRADRHRFYAWRRGRKKSGLAAPCWGFYLLAIEQLPNLWKSHAPSKSCRELSRIAIRKAASARKSYKIKQKEENKRHPKDNLTVSQLKERFFLEDGTLKYAYDMRGGNNSIVKRRGDRAGSYTEITKAKGGGVVNFTFNGKYYHISATKAAFAIIYGFFPPDRYNAICIDGNNENLSKKNIALKAVRESVSDGKEKNGRKHLRNVLQNRGRFYAQLMFRGELIRSRSFETEQQAAKRAVTFRKTLTIREIKQCAKINEINISVDEILQFLAL